MQMTSDNIEKLPDFASIANKCERIDAMCIFAKLKRHVLPTECLRLGEEAQVLALECGYKAGLASALAIKGFQHWHISQIELAMQELNESAAIQQELSFFDEWGEVSMMRAMIVWGNGDYNKAMATVFDAISLLENINIRHAQGWLFWTLGVFNYDLKDYDKSLVNYNKALEIFKEANSYDPNALSYTLIGLGCCHKYKGEKVEALKILQEALEISSTTHQWMQESRSHYEIGLMLYDENKFQEAEVSLRKSYEMRKAHNTKPSMVSSLIALSDVAVSRHQLLYAMKYIEEALSLATEIGAKPKIYQCHEKLAGLHKQSGDFKDALDHYEQFYKIRSEVLGEETSNKLKNLETKDATERAEKETEIQRLHNVELKKAHDTIAEKNKEITDSINYAKIIQQAKLPDIKEIHKALPNSFVLFKPKDIVSGDFYSFHKKDKEVFIASADCTGHGVPGAFMSMIGSEKLEDAILQSTDTSEILKLLNQGIKTSLRQSDSDESTRDGMDIALCSVDTVNRIVKYAGANRPVWIIRNGQTDVKEIKATKTAIGGLTKDDQHFDTHEIKLQQGDTFYICTDGYADQFGGQNKKKLMTRKFKEILVSIQSKTMQEQEMYLDNFIEDWKGGTEQVDDILVIGVRLQ